MEPSGNEFPENNFDKSFLSIKEKFNPNSFDKLSFKMINSGDFTGIGEVLESIDLDLSAYHIAIVKPSIHVSTAEAYSGIVPKESIHSLRDLIKTTIEKWQVQNDFEQSVFAKHPAIEKLKKSLYEQGAVYAAMSGSGASVFCFFKSRPVLDCENSLVFII